MIYRQINGFYDKQSEYGKSSVCLTKLLDSKFYIGVNTALNRFKNDFQYNFTGWNKSSVEARQKYYWSWCSIRGELTI